MLAALRSSAGVEIAGVVRSTRIQAWQRLRASGLGYALYLACLMARRLRTQGLPVFSTADVNGAQARAFIDGLAPDLLVSAFFNQKIDTTLPALNIHPSLLPAFKGVDPVFHARLAGAAALGVTLHRLSPALDCGDVVAQKHLSFDRRESVLRLTERLYLEGAHLLVDSLPALGKATPQAGAGNYDSWPSRAQVRALRAQGVRLVRPGDLLARRA